MCSTLTSCCAHSDRTLCCEKVVPNRSRDERSVLAENECLLRKIPSLSLMASREQKAKTTTSDEGTNWLMEAWRKAGYTPFDKCAIAARAAALGRRTPAVMIAARPAPNPGDFSSSISSSSSAQRAHHNRKLFENSYVAGHCYFEAQAVSNKLTHGMGEKQGSKLMRSLYAAFCSGSITQLWPLRDWLDRTERQKLSG